MFCLFVFVFLQLPVYAFSSCYLFFLCVCMTAFCFFKGVLLQTSSPSLKSRKRKDVCLTKKPLRPCKGQNWEKAWTGFCVGILHLSGLQMLITETIQTTSPKVLRTILNLGGSNLICLCHPFKEIDPAAKVENQEVWSSWHAPGMLTGHGLTFPSFV